MSRRSASPAEDAIHDLLQTMSQKERDARYDAKHKQLCVSVSRALENAAWTLDEFCNNDADRQTVWTEISDGAQRMLAQLVAAGRPRASNATIAMLPETRELLTAFFEEFWERTDFGELW